MAKKPTEPAQEETALEATQDLNFGLSDADMASLGDIFQANEENIDSSELQISRVSLLQQQSPEVADDMPGYKSGMFIDNQTREIISFKAKQPWLAGKVDESELQEVDCVKIVPIFKLPTEYTKWRSRDEGGGVEWKTLDKTEERVRAGLWPPKGYWKAEPGEKKSPPVTEGINVLCAVLDENDNVLSPSIVLTFSRTSYPAGRKFVTTFTQTQRMKKAPFFSFFYWLYSKKTNDENNKWFIMQVAKGDSLHALSLPKEETKAIYHQFYDIAKVLADKTPLEGEGGKTKGEAMQENLINAAFVDEQDHGVAGVEEDDAPDDF